MILEISRAAFGLFVTVEAALIFSLFHAIRRMHRLVRERNALLREKDVVFSFVHDVGDIFADADSVDLGALLKRVLFYSLRTTHAASGAIYLEEAETFRAHAISGVFPPITGVVGPEMDRAFSKIRYAETLVRSHAVSAGEGLVGQAAATGQAILIPDAERDPRVPRFDKDFFQVHSILLVPMRFRSQVLGVLVVVNRVDGLPFVESDQNLLQALADQAAVSIYFARFGIAMDEKRRMDFDLSIARRIQSGLLPKAIPRIEGVDLAAFSVPALQIGGDYYDFVRVDDQRLGIAVADVSGKGVPAAIVMSLCRSLLRVKAPGCASPAEVLRMMNRMLSEDLGEDMFISMLYMVLDTRTRELAVARAGHLPPIVHPGGADAPWLVESRGIAIGMADIETFDSALAEKRATLAPGDTVVAYTDGVTEAQDDGGSEWGVLNLVKTIQITAIEGGGASGVADNVHQKLLRFTGEAPQHDDMTLVVMRMT